jgi:hypothetical protein
LKGREWIKRPKNYAVVDLIGEISEDGELITGRVVGPGCSSFSIRKYEPKPDELVIDKYWYRYIVSKDGSLVLDTETTLVWARCSLGQNWNGKACVGAASEYSFGDAKEAVVALNKAGGIGGYRDWIIPNIRQLLSIRGCEVDAQEQINLPGDIWEVPMVSKYCTSRKNELVIDKTAFSDTPMYASLWSGSIVSGGNPSVDAWKMKVKDGSLEGGKLIFGSSLASVRVIRAGQLSVNEAISDFQISEINWNRILSEKKAREDIEKAEILKERAAVERKAEQERREAELKAERERRAAEQERRTAEAARTTAWKKLVASGAQAMYLQAGKAQRAGSVSVNGVNFNAAELYEAIVDKFPTSEYAVKASDQLNAMGRTERQTNALREADNNASNRAACFSDVRKCEASCRANIYQSHPEICVRSCQKRCD